MPAPLTALATLRPDLGRSFQEFNLEANLAGFVATQVARPLEVARPEGSYGIVAVEDLLKSVDTARSPGSSYNRSRLRFDDVSFACQEHGVEEPVDDREARMYRDYFDAEMIAASRARHRVMQALEQRMVTMLFNSSTWTGSALTTAASYGWNNSSNGTPCTDVLNAKMKVFNATGLMPNCLIMPWSVYTYLINNTKSGEVVDRLKYNSNWDPANINRAALAAVFDLPYIIVGGGVKNSAKEGQTASVSQIWTSTMAMVCRIAETDDPAEACVARIFHYAEDGSTIGGNIESYRDETIRGNVVRCRMDTCEKVLYTEAAHLITAVYA